MRGKIVILEEGNCPYYRCPKYDMFIFHWAISGRNLSTDVSDREMIRSTSKLAEEEARSGAAKALTTYGRPLTPVSSFKSFGRTLLVSNDDWLVAVYNLRQLRRSGCG